MLHQRSSFDSSKAFISSLYHTSRKGQRKVMSLSNLDRRRLNAPPTTPPVYSPSSALASSSSSSNVRTDLSSPRSYFIQTGLVSQASGSAYLECDATQIKVACAVYGPRQARNSRVYTEEAELNVDVRFASFATRRRKKAGKDTESASLGDAVRTALLPSLRLDLLPKASIDVFITILEVGGASRGASGSDGDEGDEGAAAAAATTIASCALADAGIEMWGLVVGLTGVVITPTTLDQTAAKQTQQIIVDPSSSEMQRTHPDQAETSGMTLYTMPALGTVTSIEQWGNLDLNDIDRLMDALQRASHAVHYSIAKALKEGYLARERRSSEKGRVAE